MKKKVLPFLLAVALVANFVLGAPLTMLASQPQQPVRVETVLSKTAAKPGDQIEIKVSLDGYDREGVDAFQGLQLDVGIPTDYLQYDSALYLFDRGEGLVDMNFRKYDQVLRLIYNGMSGTLPKDTTDLLIVKATVLKELPEDVSVPIAVKATCAVNHETEYPSVSDGAELSVLVKKPVILLNGEPNTGQPYGDNVLVTFDKGQGSYRTDPAQDWRILLNRTMFQSDNTYYLRVVDAAGNTAEELLTIKLAVSMVAMETAPDKTEYQGGEDSLDLTGAQIHVTYKNGSTKVLPVTAEMCSGYDLNAAGRQQVLVTYEGKKTYFEIVVGGDAVTSVEWASKPSKTEYVEKTPFDPAGGALLVTYADGRTETVPLAAAMCSGFDMAKTGRQTVTVSYEGKTLSFEIDVKAKSILSGSVTPPVVSQLEGKDLDLTGGSLELVYDNGETASVPLAGLEITGYDKNKIGEQQLSFLYEGRTYTFSVTVEKKSLEKIEVTALPQTSYVEKNAFDPAGGKLTLTYNNGSSEVIDLTAEMCDVPDMTKVGDAAVVVRYGGKTAEILIHIRAKSLAGISVERPAGEQLEGKELDLTGASLLLRYDNGDAESVPMTAEMVSGYDSAKVGEQTLLVTYQGKTAEFTVVVAAKSLESIALTALPKTAYIERQAFDPTGGKLTLSYDNGTTEVVDLTAAMCAIPDMGKRGDAVVTVTYGGKTTQYTIHIRARQLAGFTFTPPAVSQLEGTEFDFAGSSLVLLYDNGEEEPAVPDASMLSGFDSSKTGEQIVTITVQGIAKTFSVTVAPKSLTGAALLSGPEKTVYIEGEALDLSGAALKLSYDNGSEAVVPVSLEMVSGFDKDKVGDQTVTVLYQGYSFEFAVTVEAKQLVRIQIAAKPAKLAYLEGQPLDLAGLAVNALYNNGQTLPVSLGELSAAFDNTTLGTQIVVVSYGGKTAEFEVEVLSRADADALSADIAAVDPDSLTTADADAVAALRARYNALSPVEQQAVTGLATLEAAEKKLDELLYPALRQEFLDGGVVVSAPAGSFRYDTLFAVAEANLTPAQLEAVRALCGDRTEALSVLSVRANQDGTYTLRLKLDGAPDSPALIGFDADGKPVELAASFADGYAAFTTDRMGVFAVVNKASSPKPEESSGSSSSGSSSSGSSSSGSNGSGPKTGDAWPVALPVAAVLLGAAAFVIRRRAK